MNLQFGALAAALCLALASHPAAMAADLVVSVRTPAGAPVKDAVVTLKPAAAGPAGPIRFPWPMEVSQQNIRFDPFVLIAPLGADVSFPNKDKVRHHVYSFSPVKKFELKLYGKEEARTVRFDKAGVVALGCNIHDSMVAYIFVTDTPWTAKTDASGDVTLRGAPAGAAALSVWQPYMKTAGNRQGRQITVPAQGGREAVTADLRPADP